MIDVVHNIYFELVLFSFQLAQLRTTRIHYTYTVPLPGFADKSAFRVSFTNHVNLRLRQWDSWRALNGRSGLEIDSSDSEMSLSPSKHVWIYGWHFLKP